MNMLRRWRWWVLAVCIVTWTSAFVATHIPAGEVPDTGMQDTSLHLVGFLGLAGVFWLTLAAYGNGARRRILIVIVTMMIYAAVDEYTQAYFHRDTSLSDWRMDVLGTLCAVTLLEAISRLTGWWRPAPQGK